MDICNIAFENIHTLEEAKELIREQAMALQKKEEAIAIFRAEAESYDIIHEVLGSGKWSMDFDEQGTMVSVFWSNEFRRMLGYAGEEDFPNVLESWSSLLHPNDREHVLKEYYETIRDYSGRKIYDVEYRLMTKDRGYRWYRATGKPSRRPDGTPVKYIGVFVDITEQKRIRAEVAEKQRLLEVALEGAQQSSRSKTMFLNNMSHDIRTPMNAIIGFSELAVKHIDNQGLVRDYLQKILTSGNHLLSLINDVLDMSRIESGRVQLVEQECNLSVLVHSLVSFIQSQVSAKQQKLFIDTYQVQDEDVYADKLKMNQVLINILSNAVKYTPATGEISFRISQLPSEREGYARYEFRIRDNGMGMSPEFTKRIFDAFSREETSTRTGIQGTGLGMAITKNIVDLMGGTIGVQSEKGKGSEFVVTVEFRLQEKAGKQFRLEEAVGMKALIVDDDFQSCNSVTEMLKSIGMRSEWTTSARDAIFRSEKAASDQDPYQLFIIDLLMPERGGIETVKRIRRIAGDQAPVIILTAYDWSDVEKEAREAGVTAFCEKPLFLSDLISVLSKAFGKENKEQEGEEAPAPDFGGKRVLLVEDVDMNRQLAGFILSEAGFLVEEAPDGTDAVEMVRQSEEGYYDIILMDVQMPVMNGYEATRNIRNLPRKDVKLVPILAMTANAFDEDKARALKCGMNDHIAKPLDVGDLMAKLAKYLLK